MFAESFYNDKDLVFLAFFTIGLNASIKFILSPTWRMALLCALACALAINIRLIGILLPLIVLGILCIRILMERSQAKIFFGVMLWFSLATLGLTILFWPWLWSNPFEHLMVAFSNMRQFRWFGFPFYMGQYYPVKELPWHYLIVSIAITTPLWILALFIFGAGQTLWQCIGRNGRLWNDNDQMQDLIFLAIAVGPVAAIILMDSVVYNGWRHVYFIYPAIILIAIKALHEIWRWCTDIKKSQIAIILKRGVLLILASSMIMTAHWMVAAHPMQNVYFNWLAGYHWKDRWEVDYWGLANRQALQLIADVDSRPLIRVWPGSNMPLYYALKMLPEKDRNRLAIISDESQADYIVTNYHGNDIDYHKTKNCQLIKNAAINSELIYSIYRCN